MGVAELLCIHGSFCFCKLDFHFIKKTKSFYSLYIDICRQGIVVIFITKSLTLSELYEKAV